MAKENLTPQPPLRKRRGGGSEQQDAQKQAAPEVAIRRVAVTGAAGYLGSLLIQRLEREAAVERILALDNRSLGRGYTSKVVFRRQDINAPMGALLGENGIESIVHLAYVLKPGRSRDKAHRVNVGGTASVLEACAQAGVRHILYLSSASVYGAYADNPPLLTEESPVRPLRGFQYSEDKARAEALIREFAERHHGLTATVLRACPVIGANADNFIAQAFSKPVLVGVRGCDPPMQLLHEDDMAEAMWQCLVHPFPGVYNIAGEGTIRWSEMAALFGRRLVNLPAPVIYGLTGLAWGLRLQSDSPPCGLDFIRHPWTVSTEKIKRELGFEARYTSREAWEAFARRQSAKEAIRQ